jgi:(p)ppGpp synthase/HD superfamily hydrolase
MTVPAIPPTRDALVETLACACGTPLAPRVLAVLQLAHGAHEGQLRRARAGHERLPYIVHPVGTAVICCRYYASATLDDSLDTVVCTALAHDLLEDTDTDPALLEQLAGRRVRLCVEALTRAAADGDGDRMSTGDFASGIVAAGRTAVFVKLCDSMDNLGEPELVPPKLLGRLADKARRHYLPMLDACGLGESLWQAYLAAITAAEGELAASAPSG